MTAEAALPDGGGAAGSDAAVVRSGLLELAGIAGRAARDLAEPAAEIAGHVVETLEGGGKLLFCGNGGSAATAQHLATEYVVGLRSRRRPLAAIALTTDTSLLTAGADANGFEEVFAGQIRAVAREGDILFLLSTSGESVNLLRAVEAASGKGVRTVAFLATGGGNLHGRVDHALVVATDEPSHAQEIQLALGHLIRDIVDRAFARKDGRGSR